MTFDELCETTAYDNNALKQFFLLQVGEDQVEALLLLDVRPKAFQVTLASRPRLYSGQQTFWMPRAAFAIAAENDEYRGILQMTPWFRQNCLDMDMKRNLNILY